MVDIHVCRLLAAILVVLALVGCATVNERRVIPENLVEEAQPAGISEARFWGDDIPPKLEERVQSLTKEEARASYPALAGLPHNYLAISGGGAQGAYGAGLLVGWTEAGNRPEFQMVTGVSTGALIAPFAFLGPSYDDVLKQVYTTTSTEDILKQRFWPAIPFSDAAADATPLLELLNRFVNDDVVAAIASEYKKGRRLYIGTTDLDSMRPRIWNIGAIASSSNPQAKKLIHKILLASASIPGAFPPVRIEVEARGGYYEEMHVDGGTATQVFVYPAATDWRKLLNFLEVPGRPNIYVIRNATLVPDRKEVKPFLIPIASRSISSLIRTQGLGDLYLIYMLARRDGANFRLAYLPSEEDDVKPEELFDPIYMGNLFERGYSAAKEGYPWKEAPPGWIPPN